MSDLFPNGNRFHNEDGKRSQRERIQCGAEQECQAETRREFWCHMMQLVRYV